MDYATIFASLRKLLPGHFILVYQSSKDDLGKAQVISTMGGPDTIQTLTEILSEYPDNGGQRIPFDSLN